MEIFYFGGLSWILAARVVHCRHAIAREMHISEGSNQLWWVKIARQLLYEKQYEMIIHYLCHIPVQPTFEVQKCTSLHQSWQPFVRFARTFAHTHIAHTHVLHIHALYTPVRRSPHERILGEVLAAIIRFERILYVRWLIRILYKTLDYIVSGYELNTCMEYYFIR